MECSKLLEQRDILSTINGLFDFFLCSDDLLTEKVRINKTNIFPDWEEFGFVQMDRSHMVLVFPGKVEQPWRELSEINDQSDET